MKTQYWIIDTYNPGDPNDEFCASGPYPTIKAAEQHILSERKLLFESSCSYLQRDSETHWCKPLHIVQVIRTVQPAIRASIKLEDV
jgi:hypothetical protein